MSKSNPNCPVDQFSLAAKWEPATLGRPDIILAAWAMGFMACIRGFDYGTGAEIAGDIPKALAVVEAAAPIAAWAAWFGTGGVILMLGVMLTRHSLVWLGHTVLAVAYITLGFGILLGAFAQPWADGIRNATALLLPALLHTLLSIRTGMAPPPIPPMSPIPAPPELVAEAMAWKAQQEDEANG